jgi:hypothetical protein
MTFIIDGVALLLGLALETQNTQRVPCIRGLLGVYQHASQAADHQ